MTLIKQNPAIADAYICHLVNHWFTIRKINERWINLNSLLTAPQRLSNFYLSIFLAQLRANGYTIFVVTGVLPSFPPDVKTHLGKFHIIDTRKPPDNSPAIPSEKDQMEDAIAQSLSLQDQKPSINDDDDDEILKRVLQESLATTTTTTTNNDLITTTTTTTTNNNNSLSTPISSITGLNDDDDDEILKRVLQESLATATTKTDDEKTQVDNMDDDNNLLKQSIENTDQDDAPVNILDDSSSDDDNDLLKQAIEVSLQTQNTHDENTIVNIMDDSDE